MKTGLKSPGLPKRVSSSTGLTLTLLVGALLLAGCRSVVFDLRRLDQPVIANANPFLVSTPPTLVLSNAGTFGGELSWSEVAVGSSSHMDMVKDAQVRAFEQIGGDTNRLIRNITLEVDYTAANLLLLLSDKLSVNATGEVAEICKPGPSHSHTIQGGGR